MKAEYTCVSAFGRTVTVEADIKDSIEKIKEMAGRKHCTMIMDVVEEKPLGDCEEEEEEEEEEMPGQTCRVCATKHSRGN